MDYRKTHSRDPDDSVSKCLFHRICCISMRDRVDVRSSHFSSTSSQYPVDFRDPYSGGNGEGSQTTNDREEPQRTEGRRNEVRDGATMYQKKG